MKTPYRISSYKARKNLPVLLTGHPCIEASEQELAAIFRSGGGTGKPGRPTAPRRHLDANLHHSPYHRGQRCDANNRTFDICRTLIITRHNKPAAEATITRVTPFAHFTRVHFISPTKH